jgi:hypothetical protein
VLAQVTSRVGKQKHRTASAGRLRLARAGAGMHGQASSGRPPEARNDRAGWQSQAERQSKDRQKQR